MFKKFLSGNILDDWEDIFSEGGVNNTLNKFNTNKRNLTQCILPCRSPKSIKMHLQNTAKPTSLNCRGWKGRIRGLKKLLPQPNIKKRKCQEQS